MNDVSSSTGGHGTYDTDRERIVYEDRGPERRAEWGAECMDTPEATKAWREKRRAESRYDSWRRRDLTRWTPAERTIANAVVAVEALPADERLTRAVVLLCEAQEAVADFVDGVQSPGPLPALDTTQLAEPQPADGDICESEPWATVFRYMASRLLPYRPSYQLAANALGAARAELRALARERNRLQAYLTQVGEVLEQNDARHSDSLVADVRALAAENERRGDDNASLAEHVEILESERRGHLVRIDSLAARVAELEQSIHDIVTAGDAEASKLRRAFRIAPDGRSLQEQLLEVAQQQSAQPSGDVGEALERVARSVRMGAHVMTCPASANFLHLDHPLPCACGVDADLATVEAALARGAQAEREVERQRLRAEEAEYVAREPTAALDNVVEQLRAAHNAELDDARRKLEAERDALRERCERLAPLVEIAREFVDRRERGDFRSNYTYNRLRAALAAAKGAGDGD